MPPQEEGVGIGELSRQVRDVLARFEGLATRLDSSYVRRDNFDLYSQLVNQALAGLQDGVKKLASAEAVNNLAADIEGKASKGQVDSLETRIKDLEDDKRWLVRLVATFIILGVLGAVFAVSKAGGG